jgi:hypothetical protein
MLTDAVRWEEIDIPQGSAVTSRQRLAQLI